MVVSDGVQRAVEGEMGVHAGHAFMLKNATITPYARLSLHQSLKDDNKVTVNSANFSPEIR